MADEHEENERPDDERIDPIDRGIKPVGKKQRSAPKGLLIIGSITVIALVLVNWNALFGSKSKQPAQDQPEAVGVPSDQRNSNVSDLNIPDEPIPEESDMSDDKKERVIRSGNDPAPTPPPTAKSGGNKRGPMPPGLRKRRGGVFAYSGGSGGSDESQDESKNRTSGTPKAGPGNPEYDRMARRVEQAQSQRTASGGGSGAGGIGGSGASSNGGSDGDRGDIAGALKTGERQGESASLLQHPTFMLTQGAFLNCALETAISSDVSGMVSCRVTSDVYSTNGKMVLIDRGSRLVGQYKGGLTKGQARVFVVWERVETPEGVLVNLDSPGADALGRAGLDGRIDRHFWQRFGGALLVSVIGDLGQYVANKGSNGSQGNTIQFGGTQTAGEQAATTVLEHQIDIPPTLNKNQGDNISVFVARDLDFSSVYDLRVTR